MEIKKRNIPYFNEEYGILTSDNVLLFLGLHLVVVNAKILHDLSPQKFNQPIEWITAIVFAVAYSFSTIYIIRQRVPVVLKVTFGILDGLSVFLWYNMYIVGVSFSLFGSVLFSLFTVAIMLSMGFLKYKESNLPDYKSKFHNLEADYAKLKLDYGDLENKIKVDSSSANEDKFSELTKECEKSNSEVARLTEELSNVPDNYSIYKVGFALYIKSIFNKTKDPTKLKIAYELQVFISEYEGDIKGLSDMVVRDYQRMFPDLKSDYVGIAGNISNQ